jgi:hypothetical protein
MFQSSQIAEIRICEVCSQEYAPKRANIKYGNPRFCSRSCKHEGLRRGLIRSPGGRNRIPRNIQICANHACGKKYERLPSGHSTYCSRDCYREDACRLRRIIRPRKCVSHICENAACAKEFVVPRGHNKKKGARMYCSDSCKWAAWRHLRLACPICQRVVPSTKHKYCSIECYRKALVPTKVQSPQRRCPECGGSIILKYARRCQLCRELRRIHAKTNERKRQYRNRNTGRELVAMFPNLQEIVSVEMKGYMGEQRRNKRKEVLQKIGAEGLKMFNMKQRRL